MIPDRTTHTAEHFRALSLDAELILLDEHQRRADDLIHTAERRVTNALRSGTDDDVSTAGQHLAGAHAVLAFVHHRQTLALSELRTINTRTHHPPRGGDARVRDEAR